MERQPYGISPVFSDFYERFIDAFDEMIQRMKAHFVMLWKRYPEKRAELKTQVQNLTCAEIEERRAEEDFKPLFDLVWEYALTNDFNRVNIDRALHRVRLDIAEGKVFPEDPST